MKALLTAFISRLRCVPAYVVAFVRWSRGWLIGEYIPPNLYYDELREIQARGTVEEGDVDRVIVPLLVTRGDEIALLRREVRHEITRGTVLYGVVVVLLCIAGWGYGEVRKVTESNRVALHRLDEQAKQIKQQQRSQEESRRIGRATSCAIQSAATRAAIMTILGSVEQPPKFERNLVRLGFPPEAERRVQAQRTAKAYALLISRAVEKAAREATSPGPPASRNPEVGDIVKKNGTLDCRKLAALSGVKNTP